MIHLPARVVTNLSEQSFNITDGSFPTGAKDVYDLRTLGGYTRHVFLCTGPSCCTPEVGLEAWEALKKELKARGLTDVTHRTKAACLRTQRRADG